MIVHNNKIILHNKGEVYLKIYKQTYKYITFLSTGVPILVITIPKKLKLTIYIFILFE